MIETVPSPYGLNEAFENLAHRSALYLKGDYIIDKPLRCTNRIGVSIFGNHSKIIPDSTFPSDKPMLDCCGTFNSTFYDLFLKTAEGTQPKAGLVIGRNATLNGKPLSGGKCPPKDEWINGECPNGPFDVEGGICFPGSWSGGGCLFSNMHIMGTYGVSPYYNCGGEGHTFINSLFKSENKQPAYVDTCLDFAHLTGIQCVDVSNVDKYFYACTFRNAAENPIMGIKLVNLYRSQQNISFRDCYFATGPHPNSTVINLTEGGDKGQTFNLLIDGGRVEIGGQKKPTTDPSGIRLLRINRNCSYARIVGLRYCIKSDYVISTKGLNGKFVYSALDVSTQASTKLEEPCGIPPH